MPATTAQYQLLRAQTGPTITTVGTLTTFSTPVGTPSAYQTYTVAGSNLTADISISAPAGFEISKDDGATYGSSVTLAQTGGSVATTTIRVRLTGAALGTYSGNLAHTSSGATEVDLAVSGTVAVYYTLTAGNDGHGSVTLNPTGGSYASGHDGHADARAGRRLQVRRLVGHERS